jgi:hypothetical protein
MKSINMPTHTKNNIQYFEEDLVSVIRNIFCKNNVELSTKEIFIIPVYIPIPGAFQKGACFHRKYNGK